MLTLVIMGRIINCVGNDGSLNKIVFYVSYELSKNKRVCLIDMCYGMNQMIYLFDNFPKLDLKDYLVGEKNIKSVISKVDKNLFLIKTNNVFFDYQKHNLEIKDLIIKISYEFDYLFLVGSLLNFEMLDFRNEVSSELLILIDNMLESVMFAKNILKRSWGFDNLKNKKIILHNYKVIGEIRGYALSKEKIEEILKTEVLYVKTKLPEGKHVKNRTNKLIAKSIEKNKTLIVNYKRKYTGVVGWIRRMFYEKFE